MKASPSELRGTVAPDVLRLTLDLSQEGLAAEAGLHRTYIGAIKRAERNRSLENVERSAKALRVAPPLLVEPAP